MFDGRTLFGFNGITGFMPADKIAFIMRAGRYAHKIHSIVVDTNASRNRYNEPLHDQNQFRNWSLNDSWRRI